jgi:hypothetical protein
MLNRLFTAFAAAVVIAAVAGGALTPSRAVADEPKPVFVTNEPTVKAEQQGPWTVALSNPVTLSSGGSVGIDPAQNVVRLAAPEPMQASSSLFIDYSELSWTWAVPVPVGKQLAVEYVSGHFEKRIASTYDENGGPLLLTVTTTNSGQTVDHVVPIKTTYIENNIIAYFVVSHAVTLYADPGTNVTLKLQHLFSKGYQYQGAMSVSGHLTAVP